MFRISPFSFMKASPVQIRGSSLSQGQLSATPRYQNIFVHRLHKSFNRVSNENRFESLSIILSKLSSHVGRRQYAMQHSNDLTQFLPRFKQLGLDWHELLALSETSNSSNNQNESNNNNDNNNNNLLIHVLDKQVGMTPSQRRIFMTAIHCKLCGVLKEGSSKKPGIVCMNRGKFEHGFRCGEKGHNGLLYFEGKYPRSKLSEIEERDLSSFSLPLDKNSSNVVVTEEGNEVEEEDENQKTMNASQIPKVEAEFASPDEGNDVRVRVSSRPDFRIVGRLFHDSHPRAWSTITVPSFDVQTIGYEFYLHPSDARVKPQIVENAHEWELHAEAIRHVLWELLEINAIEKPQVQSFELKRGDVRSERDVLNLLRSYYCSVDPETGIIIENCMPLSESEAQFQNNKNKIENIDTTISSSSASLRNVIPWFIPSDPRPLDSKGIPTHFPLAPSFAVQCLYRQPENTNNNNNINNNSQQQQQNNLISPPYLEFRCFGHKNACFTWPTSEVKKKAISEILEFARKVPFVLPFTLYYRIDGAEELARRNGQMKKQRDLLLKEKSKYFDLTKYGLIWLPEKDQEQQDGKEEEEKGNVIHVEQEEEEGNKTQNNDNKKEQEEDNDALEAERLAASLNPEGWD